jgi:multiple RNA-binding domain-containing protein 1
VLSVKIVRNKDNQQSKGYGFVEMETTESAKRAIKKLQNHMHDEHAFKLSLAQKSTSIEDATKKAKKDKLLGKRKNQNELSIAGNESAKSNKLLVKNLAFEATPDDVRELFKQYGALKKVRLPKKVNSTNHRGFGFVEFISPEEAL